MDDLPPTLLPGAAFALLALWAWLADRWRFRRRDPDAVGLVPWTGVFVVSLLPTIVLLGLALRDWLVR